MSAPAISALIDSALPEMLVIPELLFAHGIGSRGTLPLPLWQFSWAAIAALGLSFVGLGALWKTPKLSANTSGRIVPGSAVFVKAATVVARVAGMAIFVLTLAAALFGTDIGGETVNLAPVSIYVALWVIVPILSAFTGDIWKAFNPFQTIGLLFDEGCDTSPEGCDTSPPNHQWVAVALAFGFLFLELAHPAGDSPRILGYAMLVYTSVIVAGLFRFGRVWLDRADAFGITFSLIAAISPLWVDKDSNLRLRLPLSGLSTVQVRPATMLLILTVLGGTSFDGFSESPIFTDLVGRQNGWEAVPALTIGLVLMILVAAVIYWTGSRSTANVTGITQDEAADSFAPSLIPIVWAYHIAHYAQLFVDQVQSFVFRLSNPFGNFDAEGNPLTDWFGTASGEVNLNLINVDLIAWVQALSIVGGHVLAVLYAHDLAVTRFDHKNAAKSQQTMLFVMVLYSVAGLWLLFSA